MSDTTDPTTPVPFVTVDPDQTHGIRYLVYLPSGVRVTVDDVTHLDGTVDVWVDTPVFGALAGTVVSIGDTPEDGFATFVSR